MQFFLVHHGKLFKSFFVCLSKRQDPTHLYICPRVALSPLHKHAGKFSGHSKEKLKSSENRNRARHVILICKRIFHSSCHAAAKPMAVLFQQQQKGNHSMTLTTSTVEENQLNRGILFVFNQSIKSIFVTINVQPKSDIQRESSKHLHTIKIQSHIIDWFQ